MTTQNWIMISPVLIMLLFAVCLAPGVLKARKKYSKMVRDMNRTDKD